MTLRIQIDTRELAKTLTAVEEKQLPFAISTAVNLVATGKTAGLTLSGSAQEAERKRIASVFTLRRPDFVEKQGVKVLGGFATKAKPSITMGVDPKADFLDKFEPGGIKEPRKVGGLLAVPVDVKRNTHDVIPTSQRPAALLGGRRTGRTALQRGRGRTPISLNAASRFFIVRPGDTDPRVQHLVAHPGIYGRFGKQRERLQLMYDLEHDAKVKDVLEYARTMEKAVTERWTEAFRLAFAKALATTR